MFKKMIFITLVFLSSFLHAQDEYKDHVKISLAVLNKGENQFLAVSLKNIKGWHTYWKNPGSAGKEIEFHFDGIKTSPLEWPAPRFYREAGDLYAYGYSNEYSFFFEIIEPPKGPFKLKTTWLICKEICIPGQKTMEASLNGSVLVVKNEFNTSMQLLEDRFSKIPRAVSWPEQLQIKLSKGLKENTLDLHYQTKRPFPSLDHANFLTPFPTNLITFNQEVLSKKDSLLKGHLPLEWDGEYEEPEIPLPTDGVFKSPLIFKFIYHDPISKKPVLLEKSFDRFELIAQPVLTAGTTKPVAKTPPSTNSLFFYVILGLLGGLILNVMPCVLPVISLKLFNLAAHSDESEQSIFKHNLYYTLGVISTFVALAGVVLLLKYSGESVGWGFQLQSPYFVSIMSIFLFILGLNLFGLFEFKTPGGKSLGDVQLKKGFLGDFMGGVLATILSTPCSAPLLGSALTFAFTAGVLEIFIIFISIGIGLASPFILTGFFPSLIKFLPKPGLWMENVKKFLGLTMFLTVLWLLDVFNSLTDLPLAYTKINVILLFIFFAFYFDNVMAKKKPLKIFFYIFPVLLYVNLIATEIDTSYAESNVMVSEKQRKGLPWESWSEEKMNQMKGELVFVDFTAKWCLTCKVNEKLVLETKAFEKLVENYNIKLLLADWTKRDPIIEEFLKRHGHVGVPVYFIQKKNGELVDLGETISISEIESHLN